MNKKSVAKAILEAVDDQERDDAEQHDELVPEVTPDIDKVVPDRQDDPEFAPDANMTIKDQAPAPAEEPALMTRDQDGEPEEPTLNEPGEMPTEPGGIDLERVNSKAVAAGLHPVEGLEGLDMYTLYDGAKHEFEHTKDFDVAAAIAAHHLAKTPDYYERLEAMEKGETAAGGIEPEVERPPTDDDQEDVV